MIRGAAAGDHAERAAFARRYERAAREYLAARWRASPDPHAIDDAVQEVFLECFRQGGALDRLGPAGDGGFRGFFYGVVRNVALRAETRAARQYRRAPAGESQLENQPAEDDRLSQVFDRAWARTVMRQAADRQAEWARVDGPEAARRVELLRLRFQNDMPIRDIAALWNEDPVRVHREYARARREFRDALLAVLREHNPRDPAAALAECESLLGLLA